MHVAWTHSHRYALHIFIRAFRACDYINRVKISYSVWRPYPRALFFSVIEQFVKCSIWLVIKTTWVQGARAQNNDSPLRGPNSRGHPFFRFVDSGRWYDGGHGTACELLLRVFASSAYISMALWRKIFRMLSIAHF